MKTVVYYTANHESPSFEEKILRTLKETIKDLPLISVSQKPIDAGINICVGEIGVSVYNAMRQLQIGAELAKTKYIILAESDYLYSPEYFEFNPVKDDVFYTPTPIYFLSMIDNRSRTFRLKPWGCEGATIVGKECLLKRLDELLSENEKMELFDRKKTNRIQFETTIPTVMIKTNSAMNRKDTHGGPKLTTIPYWGDAKNILDHYK